MSGRLKISSHAKTLRRKVKNKNIMLFFLGAFATWRENINFIQIVLNMLQLLLIEHYRSMKAGLSVDRKAAVVIYLALA